MEDQIQTWIDDVLNSSQVQWEFWKNQDLLESNGWNKIFSAFCMSIPSPSGYGLLLTGSDTLGRQLMAMHMLRQLEEGFTCLFIDGSDLADSGAQIAKRRLNQLLDHFYEEGTGLCLVLEGMENCPCRREVLHFLGQRLCEYRMFQDQLTPLFLILLEDTDLPIPSLLRKHLQLFPLKAPDLDDRMAFLEHHGRSLRNYVSLSVFAKVTDGVDYAQLQDLVRMTECLVDSLDGSGVSDEDLQDFLEVFLPKHTPNPVADIHYTLQQLFCLLPELLKNIPQAAPQPIAQPVPQPVPTPMNQTESISDKRQQIENMPPLDLSIELFGKEAVEEMRKMALN